MNDEDRGGAQFPGPWYDESEGDDDFPRNVYVVYRRGVNGKSWRVATFREEKNATKFLDEKQDPMLFVSCGTTTVKDLSLVRD